jgi:hypothetical protein
MRLLSRLAWVALAVSACLILLTAFQWSLVDLLTPFLLLPLQGIVWLTFAVVLVWSLAHFVRNRQNRASLFPLVICAVSLCLVAWVPWTDLWLRFNFASNKAARERIVRDVYEGTLTSYTINADGVGTISLPNNAPQVSNGGNEIETARRGAKTYVFFYTFRGILSSYAGFLYVPTGGDPSEFSDLNEKRRSIFVKYDDHWFFVSHHN